MKKALKKLKKLKAELDLLEVKEDRILADMDDALEELENCDHSDCK
jgi:seryl-tRNA synthetase